METWIIAIAFSEEDIRERFINSLIDRITAMRSAGYEIYQIYTGRLANPDIVWYGAQTFEVFRAINERTAALR